jgi:hypothetical protein
MYVRMHIPLGFYLGQDPNSGVVVNSLQKKKTVEKVPQLTVSSLSLRFRGKSPSRTWVSA